LEKLPIEYLSFAYSTVGDSVAEHAARLKGLKTLGIDDTQVSDKCLPPLVALEKLEVLWLTRSTVGDAGVAQLKQMTWLKTLHAEETKITEQGFAELRAALKETTVLGAPEGAPKGEPAK
jgi:hypothetical protein